ncbi:MAG: hypothetical protein JSS79_14000 [Bacteroidetes bacterium]|nr:hypothetical protein [Bacteroidota bacterium]
MWLLWKEAFANKSFRLHFLLSLIGLAAFAISLPYFFNNVLLQKPGPQLDDPILNFFQPKDWSIEIFVLIYFSAIIFIIINIRRPATMLLTLQAYVTVNFMRMTSLYLFTLEAPEGTIPLGDPFLSTFVYGQPVYVKDLFFSGHVSTLFILFLIEKKRIFKGALLVSTVLVAIMLAWQRVHYSLDILAAPLITWIVIRFYGWFNSRWVIIGQN